MVLLDIMLPNLTGLEILEELRKDPAIKDTKIVVMSNLDSPTRQFEFMTHGVLEYIPKVNTSLEDILAVVSKYA